MAQPDVKSLSPYIIALDLGSNSVGYSAVQTLGWQELEDPSKFGIFLSGSHIFEEAGEDDKGKRTLKNQARRKHRLGRRTLRRRVQRRENLYSLFAEINALPSDEGERDAILTRHSHEGKNVQPWILRARALDEPLSLEEIGKAICHLSRSRGYLSTRDLMAKDIPAEYRKESQYADEPEEVPGEVDGEKLGVVLGGIKASYIAIKNGEARTYGELMSKVAENGQYTRHYTKRFSKPAKNEPDRVPEPEAKKLAYRSDRALIKAEFHRIFDKQSNYHPKVLTQDLREQLENIIFGQLPLKDTDSLRKPCPAYEASLCAPKTSDAFQRSRILNELFNNFTVGQKPKKSKQPALLIEIQNTFTEAQLKTLLPDLMDGIDLSVEEIIKRVGLPDGEVALKKSSGTAKRGKVLGHQVRRILRELTENAYEAWSDEDKSKVQDIINSAPWPNDAYKGLVKLGIMDERTCAKIALAPFPDGYGEYSTKFLNKMSDRVIETGEYEAIAKEKLFIPIREERKKRMKEEDLTQSADVEIKSSLIKLPPDLGLRNPIVERGIRRAVWVLNQLIYRYGIPEKIRVELPRDLTLSADKKKKIEDEIEKHRKGRETTAAKLKSLGIPETDINIKKARLLEESDCILLYENCKASYTDLNELVIDHAYPRSRLYVNDNRNLVLCRKSTNDAKSNQLLWDFLGDDFAKFQTRVKQSKNMSRGKQSWLCKNEEPTEEWLASQLAATGYIARELTKILVQLGVKVEISSGKATALLRYHWGLENLFPDWLGYAEHIKKGGTEADFRQNSKSKNRSDHRHHAIDALVVALTDISTYQRISRAHRDLAPGEDKIDWNQTCPIKNLRMYVKTHLDDIVVTSHTIQKVTGELHKQTPQKDDLRKLPEYLREGDPKSSKVAQGKLIRYDRDGKAAQVYPLKNNHHLTIYRSLAVNKKGSYDYQAEITPLIEVALRARDRKPIFQESSEFVRRGFSTWLTLQEGEIVEFTDAPSTFYKVSSISEGDYEFHLLSVSVAPKALRNRCYLGIRPRLRLSTSNLTLIGRKVRLNAFREVVHEFNPHESPQFH